MIFNYFAYNLILIYGDSNFRQCHWRPGCTCSYHNPVGIIYVQEKKACFYYTEWLSGFRVWWGGGGSFATNYFDKKRELGCGGYGKVHLGKIQDGLSVTVKRFPESNCNRFEQFMNELRILSSADHSNFCVRIDSCRYCSFVGILFIVIS